MARASFGTGGGGSNIPPGFGGPPIESVSRFIGTPEQNAIHHELLNGTRNVVVNAVAGCLSGDTIIGVNRAGMSRPYRLSDLVYKFNGGPRRAWRDRPWDLSIPTQVRSVREGTVVLQRLEYAIESGKRPTYQLKTKSGKIIIATENHKFLTTNGWVQLADLGVAGHRLLIDGGKGGKAKLSGKGKYQRMVGMVCHPYHHKSRPHCCIWTHRLIVEAKINDIPFNDFLWLVRQGKIEGLTFLDPAEWYVHHIDENTMNNHPDNLEVIKPDAHSRHHAKEGAWDHVQAHVAEDQIVSIKKHGIVETFDLTMADQTLPNFLANGIAVHNSGKTSTLVEYCKLEPRAMRLAFVAFNKHIATELASRLSGTGQPVDCMTYHSLGLKILRRTFRKVDVNQWKVYDILDAMTLPVADGQEKIAKSRIKQLVSLAKSYGVRDRASLERLVDHHDLDLNGMEEMALEYAPRVLDKCKARTGVVDFDDMVWLPGELHLHTQLYDLMLVDESQDTSPVQQTMALGSSDRLCFVGDRNQAIYGFRGADSRALDNITAALGTTSRGVVELPLTLTRRCPKSHVRLAQTIVPQITAMDDAPEGVVRYMSRVDAVNEMRPGDLVLCRVNADLLMVAYQLLKLGIKAVVKGRDIGAGIVKLVDESVELEGIGPLSIPQLIEVAGAITSDLVAKFNAIPNGRGEMRAMAARDRYECLVRMSDGVQRRGKAAGGSTEVKAAIAALFADEDENGNKKDCVTLGSIHRTKGLEASRVYVLRPDLLPHPMAKQPHEKTQELNCIYIAITRSKFDVAGGGELIFIDGECSLFGLVEQPVDLSVDTAVQL